jgi:hypothetical protein
MSCVGQDEIVIILECLPDEATVPKDIFRHLNTLYQDASRGKKLKSLYTVHPDLISGPGNPFFLLKTNSLTWRCSKSHLLVYAM